MIGARRLIWILLPFDSVLTQLNQVEICTGMPFFYSLGNHFHSCWSRLPVCFLFLLFSIDKNKKTNTDRRIVSFSDVLILIFISCRRQEKQRNSWSFCSSIKRGQQSVICDRQEAETKITIEWFHFSPSRLSLFSSLRHIFLWVSWDWKTKKKKKRIYIRVNPLRTLTIITEVNSTHTVVSNTSIDHLSDDVSTPLVHTSTKHTNR